MPTPVEVRRIRINYLIIFARKLLEVGVDSNFLIGKVEMLAQRLWPEVREETRKSYVISALKVVLEGPCGDFDPLEEELPREVARP